MSAEQNKAFANRFVEEFLNQGHLDRAAVYFTADYVDHWSLATGRSSVHHPTGFARTGFTTVCSAICF